MGANENESNNTVKCRIIQPALRTPILCSHTLTHTHSFDLTQQWLHLSLPPAPPAFSKPHPPSHLNINSLSPALHRSTPRQATPSSPASSPSTYPPPSPPK